jgi:hypothetical protein
MRAVLDTAAIGTNATPTASVDDATPYTVCLTF